MKPIRVRLRDHAYTIHLTSSYAQLPRLLDRLETGRHGWVISHRSLLDRYGTHVTGPLRRAGWTIRTITVPESELTKSNAMAERVMRRLAQDSAMRVPVLFAFGGGVVGDLTGFVAAVFRRGVPYVQLPTTLLAQVDSAIGGKVGVDLPMAKNFVGAFYQPRLVMNNLSVLQSLPVRQRRSGLSEIIKYAAIADPQLFHFLETHLAACLQGELRVDRVMVERCARIKARVVSRDERDVSGVRAQLNFGHTLGHALEAATGYTRLTHGEAIAIGMAYAAQLSAEMGVCRQQEADRLRALLTAAGLPTRATRVSLGAVERALKLDKKFSRGRMRWIVFKRIGRVSASEAVSPVLMRRVLRRFVVP